MEKPPRLSSVTHVVGKIETDPTFKEKMLARQARVFEQQDFPKLKEIEVEKNDSEKHIISLANQLTNDVLQSCGLDPFTVPEKNIHLIAADAWQRIEKQFRVGGPAMINPRIEGMLVKKYDHLMPFAHIVLHEMLHLKAFNAVQVRVRKDEKPGLQSYRSGLRITKRDLTTQRLVALNEGLNEELTARCLEKMFQDPVFEKEKGEVETIRKIHAAGGKKLPQDVYHATPLRPPHEGDITAVPIKTHSTTYSSERRALGILTEKLSERNPEKFPNAEDAFRLFVRASMSGDMTPLLIIDQTFGQFTLRKIAACKADQEEFETLVKSL